MQRESFVIILNSILYIALFAFCFFRYKKTNLSVVLSFLYMINAICGLALFFNPFYFVLHTSSNGVCTYQASFYLFTVNTIVILAFKCCDISRIKKLTSYDYSILNTIKICLCVSYTIYLLFQLPDSISFYLSSDDLSELRNMTYEQDFRYEGNFITRNIHLFTDLQLFLLIIVAIEYFFYRKFDFWSKYAIAIFLLMKISAALGWISRVAIVFSAIEIGMLLLFFFRFIPKISKKRMAYIFMIIIVPIFLFMTAISTSRFDKNEAGREAYATLLYAGEAQLNFMALSWNYFKEPLYGYKSMALFRKYLGLDYPHGKTRDGSAYDSDIVKKYHYSYPFYIFYTAVGGIYFDWGAIGTLIFAVLLFFLMHRFYLNPYRISFMTVVFTIYLSALFAKGIFYLDYSFNKSGNVLIICLVFFYFLLRETGSDYPIINRKQS